MSESSDDVAPRERPTVPRGQPFMPPAQQGIRPGMPITQGAQPGSPLGAQAASPAASDRLAVHLIWEGVLLVIAAVLVGAALASTPEAHTSPISSGPPDTSAR